MSTFTEIAVPWNKAALSFEGKNLYTKNGTEKVHLPDEARVFGKTDRLSDGTEVTTLLQQPPVMIDGAATSNSLFLGQRATISEQGVHPEQLHEIIDFAEGHLGWQIDPALRATLANTAPYRNL